MATKKKQELRRSDIAVYDIPLDRLVDNKSNPRDSSPVLLAMGYDIFKSRKKTKPSLMQMVLSSNPAERSAFVDLIERFELPIAAMGADIVDKSLLQPIGVCESEDEDGYDVVFGVRRILAFGYNFCKTNATDNPTIPGRIFKFTATDRCFVAFSENYHRLGQTAIDEAKHFLRMRNLNISNSEIAKRCGVQEQHVRRRLKLNDLPQNVQDQVAAGNIPITKAEKMADKGEREIKDAEESMQRKRSKRRVPTLTEWQKIYDTESLSEEIRRFIAVRVLQVAYSKRKQS